MLQPKRTKFRKQMTGHNRGLALRGSKVSFGEFALKLLLVVVSPLARSSQRVVL
jgi:ribosomal protein L16/L10AE